MERIIRESEHDTGKYNNLVTEYANGDIVFRSYHKKSGTSEYVELSRYVNAAEIYHDGCWMIDGHDIPYADL